MTKRFDERGPVALPLGVVVRLREIAEVLLDQPRSDVVRMYALGEWLDRWVDTQVRPPSPAGNRPLDSELPPEETE